MSRYLLVVLILLGMVSFMAVGGIAQILAPYKHPPNTALPAGKMVNIPKDQGAPEQSDSNTTNYSPDAGTSPEAEEPVKNDAWHLANPRPDPDYSTPSEEVLRILFDPEDFSQPVFSDIQSKPVIRDPDGITEEAWDRYPMLRELKEMEREEAEAAEKTIADFPRVEAALRQLADASHEQRYEIVTGKALVESTVEAQRLALPTLLELMREDPFPKVRAAAAELVYKLEGSTESLEVLCYCLSDVDREVRQYAAWSLAHSGTDAPETLPPLVAALKDDYIYVREKVAGAISRRWKIGEPAVPAAIAALEDEHWAVRSSCLFFLARVEQSEIDVFPIITAMVDDEVMEVRKSVFSVLTLMQDDPRVVPYLLDVIQGAEEELVSFALGSCEKLKIIEARPIAETLVDSESRRVAQAAGRVLMYVRPPREYGAKRANSHDY